MDADRWRRIDELVEAAAARDPADRAAFLDTACGDDLTLRREVESLVAGAADAERLLASGASRVPALAPGARLGPYEITGLLGEGGMGEVYHAWDPKLRRTVALKVLHEGALADDARRQRFVREAQAASALNHPNIVAIYDVGTAGGRDFIAMERVSGQPLQELIPPGGLPVERALDIGGQIVRAMAAAHAGGLVHRDLKPANILVMPDGHTKVIDFGLAKQAEPASPDRTTRTPGISTSGGVLIGGTPGYAAPEQIEGADVDARADVFAIGVVLYEMLTGRRAFGGRSTAAVLAAVMHDAPPPLARIRSGLPRDLPRIIDRCLEKKAAARFASAVELHDAMVAPRVRVAAQHVRLDLVLRRPAVALTLLVLALVVGALGSWRWRQESRVAWARTVAVPEIVRLIDAGRTTAAFSLAAQAEQRIPGDPLLATLWPDMARYVPLRSLPAGAEFSFREYETANDVEWTPAELSSSGAARIPLGFFRWRIRMPGYTPVDIASDGVRFEVAAADGTILLHEAGTIPDGMVYVRGGRMSLDIPGLDQIEAVALDDYLMDRYEVSNRQFKAFVDSGGYRERRYWRQPFVKDGRQIPWEQAAEQFRDRTGLPGPAGWELGTYPGDQGQYPVTGISWYEAAAYAAFAGKRLPTIYHWNHAAGTRLRDHIVRASNFDGAPAPVGSFGGLGPFGTYDMAGNAREWCWNETEDRRYVLGAGWDEESYLFTEADSRSPWDRSPTNGVRLIATTDGRDLPDRLTAAVPFTPREHRVVAVPDDVYRIYRRLYAYEKTPLLAETMQVKDDDRGWRTETVRFRSAYGNEWMTARLFLPATTSPPHQVVVYFPGSNAIHLRSSEGLTPGGAAFLVQTGRAVLYPVYQGTYERAVGLNDDNPDTSTTYRDLVIMWAKDLSRSIDYLETRTDIDHGKIAYYGLSWGAALGAIFPALEPRLAVGVLEGGGFFAQAALEEADQRTFAPRVTIPILMLNGRHDGFFPSETSQLPLFRALGTRAGDKRHEIFESGHAIQPRAKAVSVILEWLDTYMGSVR